MAKGNNSIATLVRGLIEDSVTELGYEIWDVEYVKEGATWYLRITVDRENGIGIDDCEKVHRTIDPIIDENDPIEDSYYLEVTSPGVERVLRTKEHFEKCAGQKAKIGLYKPLEGKKTLVGIIMPLPEEKSTVAIKTENGVISLALAEISKANIVFDFE